MNRNMPANKSSVLLGEAQSPLIGYLIAMRTTIIYIILTQIITLAAPANAEELLVGALAANHPLRQYLYPENASIVKTQAGKTSQHYSLHLCYAYQLKNKPQHYAVFAFLQKIDPKTKEESGGPGAVEVSIVTSNLQKFVTLASIIEPHNIWPEATERVFITEDRKITNKQALLHLIHEQDVYGGGHSEGIGISKYYYFVGNSVKNILEFNTYDNFFYKSPDVSDHGREMYEHDYQTQLKILPNEVLGFHDVQITIIRGEKSSSRTLRWNGGSYN